MKLKLQKSTIIEIFGMWATIFAVQTTFMHFNIEYAYALVVSYSLYALYSVKLKYIIIYHMLIKQDKRVENIFYIRKGNVCCSVCGDAIIYDVTYEDSLNSILRRLYMYSHYDSKILKCKRNIKPICKLNPLTNNKQFSILGYKLKGIK